MHYACSCTFQQIVKFHLIGDQLISYLKMITTSALQRRWRDSIVMANLVICYDAGGYKQKEATKKWL